MTSYVKYGTPLVDSERKDLVRRQWGKRDDSVKERFHGAFSGGFSAGYFNTVGSKEGWAPSTFKATREDGRDEGSRAHRREDFMDEEDLADLEDRIRLEPIYDILDAPSCDDPVYRTLRPTVNGIGYAILRKMGWKEGQGMGPKASKEVVVGDKRKNVEIAPREDQEEVFQIESNVKCHGLGYGVDNTMLASANQLNVKKQRKQRTSQKRLSMNMSIAAGYEDEDDDGDLPSSKPLPKPVKRSVKFKQPTNSQRLITSNRSSAAVCKDGNPPLQGFVLRSEPIYKPTRYPKVQVPEGFVEKLQQATSNDFSTPSTGNLDSSQRSKLLREEELPEKSIFSFISSQQRDRLAKITANNDLAKKEEEEEEEEKKRNPKFASDIPRLAPEVAERVHQSAFKPYQMQKDKYERYLSYLRSQMDEDPTLLNAPALNMRRAWIQELNEFNQVAQKFRKEQASFNGRFTYASSPGTKPSTAQKKPTRKPEEIAAERGAYGPKTRTVDTFHPERLLCKRFNVAYKGVRPSDSHQTQRPQEVTPAESLVAELEIDPTRNPILEAPRAPQDLFQLVFGQESEEEEL